MSKKSLNDIFNKFYELTNILLTKADYYFIIGKRSNGKTFSVKKRIIEKAWNEKKDGAIIRRYEEDFKKGRGAKLFKDIVDKGIVEEITQGVYDTIIYKSMSWTFAKTSTDEEGNKSLILAPEPFCYAFALSSGEHDKSTSHANNVSIILFDEVITRHGYLPDEFVTYMNVLSTIIRLRDGVEIFMLGNTVNKYCPYFDEMGLKNVKYMEQGTIDVYTYGESGLKVAVEYCADNEEQSKTSNKYFAFNNPKLQMITNGIWELDIYPHLPVKYKPKNIIFTYFVKFDGDILQCEILQIDDKIFTYIHKKTTDIKNENDVVFSTEYSISNYHFRNITKPNNNVCKKIWWFFVNEKVFYQDNETGEILRNYIEWCKKLT